MYSNIEKLGQIPTLAQYGNILTTSKDAAQARGSGNYNPPPRWEQSIDRGYAFENAYPMYIKETDKANGHSKTVSEASNMENLNLAHFNTPSDLGDSLRKRAYTVGSTGLHEQSPGEWEGSHYVMWAAKSMQMAPDTLLNYFFSTENVNYLQDRTVSEIKRLRKKDIAKQSIDELLIIMRNKYIYALSGWLPQANNPNVPQGRGPAPCSIEERLTRLNKSVLEETVKQVLSGLDQYAQFYMDQASLPMPMSHPTYASMAGSRGLSESIGFNSGNDRTLAANSFNMRYNI
jgi:hypothetical protein